MRGALEGAMVDAGATPATRRPLAGVGAHLSVFA